MEVLYSAAQWRPLGNTADEPYIGTPRVLIFHTMSGYLAGTESMFRQGGYNGTESQFGVGMDGRVWQWQRIDRQADAQYAGNAYATSVETEDRAKDNVPWSAVQLDALVKLATWWCRTTRNPARLVPRPTDRGFGYHRQFTVWNHAGHYCPGKVREAQLRSVIIPRVAAALGQHYPPATPDPAAPEAYRPEDGDGLLELWEYDTGSRHAIRDAQAQLAAAGYKPGTADGYFGPATRAATIVLQNDHGLDPDGIIGPKTRAALTDKRRPAVPFPLPGTDWFGPPNDDPRNHSGFYWKADRPYITKMQLLLGVNPTDGRYTPQMVAKVRAWQAGHHVQPVDGLVGRITWAAMF
jgi:peptidoglycan hydrolase-like protein with peptidoglycan-binding domain